MNDLDTKTDAELNALFAEEVEGYRWLGVIDTALDNPRPPTSYLLPPESVYVKDPPAGWITCQKPTNRFKRQDTGSVPSYCASADAVMPWLEQWSLVDAIRLPIGRWHIGINPGEEMASGEAPTFARAAVIALIRAKRLNP